MLKKTSATHRAGVVRPLLIGTGRAGRAWRRQRHTGPIAPVLAQGQQTPAAQAPAGRAGQPAAGQPPARQGGGGRAAGPAFAGPPLNVLVISGGNAHDYPTQNKLLYDILSKAAPINFTFAMGMRGLPGGRLPIHNNPDYANGYDLVIYNNCWTEELPSWFMQNIVRPQQNGIPAMFFHCALHSYRSSPDGVDYWREMIGGTSRRHTFAHAMKMIWDPNDPITKGLPQWTTPVDELYVIEKFWPGAKAIGTVVNNTPRPDGTLDQGVKGPGETYPVVWTKENPMERGGARVFGTTLGHGNPTWEDPVFQEVVTRGFRWAMRKDPIVGFPLVAPVAPAGAPAAPGAGAPPTSAAPPAAPARGGQPAAGR